jgi:hypothetical protein
MAILFPTACTLKCTPTTLLLPLAFSSLMQAYAMTRGEESTSITLGLIGRGHRCIPRRMEVCDHLYVPVTFISLGCRLQAIINTGIKIHWMPKLMWKD